MDGRSGAAVEDRQRPEDDTAATRRRDRAPPSGGPSRETLDRDAAGGGELATGPDRRAGAVVEGGEGVDRPIRPRAERREHGAVPPGDVRRRHPTGGWEGPAEEECRAR